jgi:hypothetical protein
LIIGATPLAADLAEKLDQHRGYELVGVVTDGSDGAQTQLGLPILGTLDDFDRILSRQSPNLIVVASADRRGSLPIRRLLECRFQGDFEVEDGVVLYERLASAVEFTTLTPASILFSRQFHPSIQVRIESGQASANSFHGLTSSSIASGWRKAAWTFCATGKGRVMVARSAVSGMANAASSSEGSKK